MDDTTKRTPDDTTDDMTVHTHTDHNPIQPDRGGATALTDTEVRRVRQLLDDDPSSGGNRFAWFLIGFVAALLSIVVAAIVFLVVSDSDNDGNLDVNTPSVDVDG